MRNTLGATIDSASEFAKRDLQRVKDFYEYEPDALKYMLVQIKAKRAAWEKHIGLLTGTLEKIGFIPTIIALLAILIRPEIGQFSKVWVQNIAIGVFSLYFGSFVVNHLMTKLDRA